MTPFEEAFDELWQAQTEAQGVAIRATIAGYCSNAKAILSEVEADLMIAPGGGGIAEFGGYEIQVKVSDFSTALFNTAKGTAAICNGAADGLDLAVGNVQNRGATYLIRLVDYASKGG